MNKTQQHDAELIVQATPDGMRRRIAELEAENERLRAQQVADEKRGARALIEQLCSSRVDRDYIEGRFDVCFGREIARGEGGK